MTTADVEIYAHIAIPRDVVPAFIGVMELIIIAAVAAVAVGVFAFVWVNRRP